jgi:1-acyl-sn-glycerol-3-phosphate acyltransferase
MSGGKNAKKKKRPVARGAKTPPTAEKREKAAEPTHSREAVSRAVADAVAATRAARAKSTTAAESPSAPVTPATSNVSAEANAEDGDDSEAIEPDNAPEPTEDDDGQPAAVADRIRELEQRLDRMIDQSARAHDPRPAAPPPPSSRALPLEGEPTAFDTARELLSTDFYMRKWGRLGMRNRSEEVDDFGFDPVYEKKVQPVFDFLYEKYFRVDIDGIENVPSVGRCLLVANHSGTLPYDGVMIKVAVKREHPAKRDVRWLAEDFIFHFPFLGSFSNRIGAVRACQENAERLLRKEALVAVFPEGVKGIGKLFKERYQLQRFGRGGFIKLCLRTGTPIVPVAVIGAEEANPMIGRVEYLSKLIGVPYIPVTPTFPLLGPLGLVPAPTKWKILFGEKIDFDGYGPEAAEDEILVGRLAERVRATIQGMLDRGVGDRRSVFFG